MKYCKKSFTLIELLVVVAIIAILAAMLLPALSRAKISAVRVTCLGQLKQFMIGAHSYSDDYEGTFPCRASRGGYPHQMKRTSNYKYNLNPTYLKPYIDGNPQMMYCPAQNMNPQSHADAGGDVVWSSYTYFICPNGMYWQVPQPDLTKPCKIKHAERAPIWSCKLQIRYGVQKPIHSYSGGMEGQNGAMSDGSARWFRLDDTEVLWKFNNDKYFWPVYRE